MWRYFRSAKVKYFYASFIGKYLDFDLSELEEEQ